MSAPRWPAFAWRHPGGVWSARLLCEELDLTASGTTQSAALARLEEAIRGRAQQGEAPSGAEPQAPRVVPMAFTLHPEHQARGRAWPVRDAIRLLLPVVLATDPPFTLAFVPTIGLTVRVVAGEEIKPQVAHRVHLWFAQESPEEIARFLEPAATALAAVAVAPASATTGDPALDTRVVAAVADAVTGRGGQPVWCRDTVVAALAGRLGGSAVAIVGDAGSGKSAILRAAIHQAERRWRSRQRADGARRIPPRFWASSGQRLIAGMRYLGEWEGRLERVIAQLATIGGTLCVDALPELLAVGGSDAGTSIAAFLLPFVRRGELRLVGECTAPELEAMRRMLPAFVLPFSIIHVPPLDAAEALQVTTHAAQAVAQRLHLEIGPQVPREIVSLYRHHHGETGFPGPAVRFIERLGEEAARSGRRSIARGEVVAQFARDTGLPETLLRDEEPLARTQVVAQLRTRVIGQDLAVASVADVVMRIKAGLCDPQRPLGSFLFLGPTGVGKTQLAATLAEQLFPHLGAGAALIRIDMSEYAGADAVERLLGFRRQPSALVRQLHRQSSAVVLLDEVEKAHPAVFDALLGALDEGRFRDALGRVTSLRRAVVIMTSNLGAESLPLRGFGQEAAGREAAAGRAAWDAAVAFFRPEFLARIDRVVVFRALDHEGMRAICLRELGDVALREGLRARSLRPRWSDALVDMLVGRGFDPRYGARPMQRAIQDLVVAPLAHLLNDLPTLADATIVIGWDGRGLTVQTAA